MSGYDIFFLAIGTAALAFACLFNRSTHGDKRLKAENYWRATDFRWLGMVFLLMQLPIWASSLFKIIRTQDVSSWGFVGISLFIASCGIAIGREIEWGKQHGRDAPGSEQSEKTSNSNQAGAPEPS